MASIWVDAVGRALEQVLDLLGEAVRACPAEQWEAAMWPVAVPPRDQQFLKSDWTPVTDEDELGVLAQRWVQRRSAPWSVAWHALEVFDYDLNGEFAPWTPPPPFAGHPHWRDLASLEAAWTPSEMLAYVEHCHGSLRAVLAAMTDASAARTLPPAHRYAGQTHASVIVGLVAHTAEHAAQIGQSAGNLAPPQTEIGHGIDPASRPN